MKVILKADVKGVGKKDQIINASDGYARNFLLPKKLAVEANNENMSKLQSKQDANQYKKDQEREKAMKQAEKMKNIMLTIKVRVGENGKFFGAVSAKEIADELANQHKIIIDKKKVMLKESLKALGMHKVEIKLNEGVVANLKVNIIG